MPNSGRDRRQPVRSRAFRAIPIEGAPLPPRDSLMVDAPNSPLERPAPDIPPTPAPMHPMAAPPAAADGSIGERTLFDRLAGGMRIEPILGRLRAAPAPTAALPGGGGAHGPAAGAAGGIRRRDLRRSGRGRRESLHPRRCTTGGPARCHGGAGRQDRAAQSAAAQGKRAAKAGQRELNLGNNEYQLPPLDLLSLPSRVKSEPKIDESALEQNARLLETVLDDFGVKGQIVKVRPGPVVTLYELEPAPGTKRAGWSAWPTTSPAR